MDVGAPSYEMEMVRQDDDVLMPFAVMQNLFSPAKFANVYAYNGEDFYDIASVVNDIYGASSLAYSPNPYATKWYTGPFALRDNLGEAYAKYNYASMCLLLDLFFGHKEEMGIKNFDTF